ncbi:MAG: putative LPS assembly protein LptD [bacterium]
MIWRATLLAALLIAGSADRAEAQRPTSPGQPTRPGARAVPPRDPRDTLRSRADSLRATNDTTAADTVAQVRFLPPDSVMQRLLAIPGYSVTRYQAESITFEAASRGVVLTNRSLVQRDSQTVKADSIFYNGINQRVDASGKRNVFLFPGQAPVITQGTTNYDVSSRRIAGGGLSTSIDQQGQTLFIRGDRYAAVATSDSLKGANDLNYYVRDGMITACNDSVPDYYFKAKEIKRTGNFVVARPAVLYIGDVPVMWLPFVFQDIRSGRHSGILPPNVGVSDIVRNSPSYRRNVEGLGYYFALSDYFDAQAYFDWRSSAGQTELGDPGYFRYNGEVNYRWLDRFVAGRLAMSKTYQGDRTNTALSWGHSQSFTRNSSLQANVNYVTSTTLQRQTTINPYSALATISSSVNYQQKVGPAQLSIGGSNRQYPGRDQVDRNLPTVSLSTSPLSLGNWLTWTPAFNYSSSQTLNIDQPSALGLLVRRGTTPAGVDTIFGDTLKRSAYTSTLSFDTPLTIFGFSLGNRFNVSSARNDFPERAIVADVATGVEEERIYATTYKSEINWDPSFSLPSLGRNNLNLTPSLSFSNVDGNAFWIRNERTGGKWVHQTKRPSFGLSASPTLFGLFTGFGPFARIRHSIQPTFGYSYAPAAEVSDEFLAALGRTRKSSSNSSTGYLPSLAQNSLSFGLSTNFEAKLKSTVDSMPDAGEKIKLLSVNFTGINYDFERARATGSRIRGLTTQNFGYTLRSDLLPGIDVGVDYSLFEGSTLSDTARFKPYRERITSSVSFSNTNNPFAVFSRIFGKAVPPTTPGTDRTHPTSDDRYAREVASQPVAGRGSRTAAFLPTVHQGWEASFNFTSARQRPPGGNPSNIVQFDPASRCLQYNTPALRVLYDDCVARQLTNPSPDVPITSGLVGAPFYLTPPTTSLGSSLNFGLTEKWAASWQTNYDFERHSFASQIVSLQRDLHDWRAIFAFTQSPNGSFAFNFLISLKAEPELKFDYHKSTYRNEGLR